MVARRGRKAVVIELSEDEREELERLMRRRRVSCGFGVALSDCVGCG